MATEWPTTSCHGTITGVDAGCHIVLVVFSNGGTLRGILVPMQSKSVPASAVGPKNVGFVAKGMDCCMLLGKAKAAVATRKMHNAKVACFGRIVVRSIGRGVNGGAVCVDDFVVRGHQKNQSQLLRNHPIFTLSQDSIDHTGTCLYSIHICVQ